MGPYANLLLAVTILLPTSWELALSGDSDRGIALLPGVVLSAFCLANCTSNFPRETASGLPGHAQWLDCEIFLFFGVWEAEGDTTTGLPCSFDLPVSSGLVESLLLVGKKPSRDF